MEIIAIICLAVVVGTIVVILQLSRKLADTKSKLFASEASLTAEQSRSRARAEHVPKREEHIRILTERSAGDWGEMVLESILDKSGLIRDENYFVQMTRNPAGTIIEGENNQRLRPDVGVVLPDDKYIVIDSKVSLTAYTDYINADTEESRADAAARHVTSVRNHLKELKGKNYQDYVGIRPGKGNQIDFQLMFIPNEHAYLTALSLDKKLWQDAYDQRIVIISPAHVISTLRLVAQLWRRERQDRNAMKIAEESGKLYDKFVGFVDDMQRLQTALNTAQRSFDDAKKKLNEGRGNMFSKFEELKTLGARANKQLPTAND